MDMPTTTDTNFRTIDEARAAALAASQDDASRYFWIENCFGWFVNSANRLAIHTPSYASDWSGKTGSYWKNGKERNFSEKQRIADQNATPTMS
jgi:hypothetical protein